MRLPVAALTLVLPAVCLAQIDYIAPQPNGFFSASHPNPGRLAFWSGVHAASSYDIDAQAVLRIGNAFAFRDLVRDLNPLLASGVSVNNFTPIRDRINSWLSDSLIVSGSAQGRVAFAFTLGRRVNLSFEYSRDVNLGQDVVSGQGVRLTTSAIQILTSNAQNGVASTDDYINAIDNDIAFRNIFLRRDNFVVGLSYKARLSPEYDLGLGIKLKSVAAAYTLNLVAFQSLLRSSSASGSVGLENNANTYSGDLSLSRIPKRSYLNADLGLSLKRKQALIGIYVIDLIPTSIALPSAVDTCSSIESCQLAEERYSTLVQSINIDQKVRIEGYYFARSQNIRLHASADMREWRDANQMKRQVIFAGASLTSASRRSESSLAHHPLPSLRLGISRDLVSNEVTYNLGFAFWAVSLGVDVSPEVLDVLFSGERVSDLGNVATRNSFYHLNAQLALNLRF